MFYETYPRWRFIETLSRPGSFNMAFDRVLAEEYNPDKDIPVFRVYSFSPPAISLGKFQKASDIVNTETAAEDSVETVKRITGGGAIFHDNEITYSMVFPCGLTGSEKAQESYRVLCSFLMATYEKLGLRAGYSGNYGNKECNTGGICFAGREKYDIMINGKKAGGNAQKRFRGKIFQHGSIPLTVSQRELNRYFRNPKPVDCHTMDPERITFEKVKNAILESFTETFKCSLCPSRPRSSELEKASGLLEEIKAA